ncbi:hypothetical protein FSP39_019978 [Pinctada imbricata]|uniref:Integrase core domain-containing protein n=1 Tax=Pinctada imbricata TaxID=66713 RepID=A0AA88XWF2_PINIB|nr:hypothetical protein FSP39_019978 [Pinctada imbricata]
MDDIRDNLIEQYFGQGLKYAEIVHVLKHDHGMSLSLRHVKRILQKLHLERRKYSDIRSVVDFIYVQLQSSGQLHGYRIMHEKCRQNGFNVKMNDVRLILKQLDPVGVEHRTARRFRRRTYFADGPNFIWHIDGYDKLKPFGLCISGCVCGFSRKVIWLKVYNTNNNPRIIGGYYLEAVNEYGGCPRFVRGDYGTENGHVCAFQHFLRENHETNDTVQRRQQPFIYGTSTTNQRIESWWSYLRKEHIQFWLELFKSLQDSGQFSGDTLDKNLMLFCFLPLLQVLPFRDRH